MISTATATIEALRVARVTDDGELAALADNWNRLAGDVPFRRHEWLATWWRHYRTSHAELFVLTVADAAGELLGLAPWWLEKSRSHGRAIRCLGSGEVASDYVGVLAAEGREAEVAAQIAHWLSTDAARDWDLIDLDGIDPEDVTTHGVASELKGRGHAVQRRERFHSWRVALPGDFDAFVAGLSKSRRTRTRQLLRKYFDTGRAVSHMVQREDEVARGIDILRDLHQSRRESLGEAGCFASRQFGEFHTEVAGRFFDLGRLRLAWLELDGRPVAADYSLGGGDTVYYYQTGFDAKHAEASPGWLTHIASLRQAIEQGYRTFDFLRGDEPYKASWGARPRPLVELRIVANHPVARVRHAVWTAGARTKQWVKRGLELCERWRRPGGEPVADVAGQTSSGSDSTS